jgi:NAD(P)-dependent dehydrogenase (short-subunit alcohol dehydrogenase family)
MTAKYAVITGAGRGLGRHLASRYWEAGYNLGLVSRRVASTEQTVFALAPAPHQKCDVFECDLADPASVNAIAAEICAKTKQVNVLINNAAVQGPIGSLEQNDFAAWEQTIRVNLLSPVALGKGLLSCMANAQDASIINLSGGGATGPRPNFSAYASAKAALVRFSETLADEVKGEGITVNCIAPGAMKTAMLRTILERGAESSGAGEFAVAAKAFEEGGASMDGVADLALFLSSSAARGITSKLISAVWDRWECWPEHVPELAGSDLYTLRRIVGRDRGCRWGDR